MELASTVHLRLNGLRWTVIMVHRMDKTISFDKSYLTAMVPMTRTPSGSKGRTRTLKKKLRFAMVVVP